MFSGFGFDFASVAGKEGEEALCSAVDDVDFVRGNGVHDLFALLYFAFWELHELCLRRDSYDAMGKKFMDGHLHP